MRRAGLLVLAFFLLLALAAPGLAGTSGSPPVSAPAVSRTETALYPSGREGEQRILLLRLRRRETGKRMTPGAALAPRRAVWHNRAR